MKSALLEAVILIFMNFCTFLKDEKKKVVLENSDSPKSWFHVNNPNDRKIQKFPHCELLSAWCTFIYISNFLPLWFYVKSLLADFRMWKPTFVNNSRGFESWFFGEFQTWKCQKLPKKSKFTAARMVNGNFWGLQNDQTWFHVISEISTLWLLDFLSGQELSALAAS